MSGELEAHSRFLAAVAQFRQICPARWAGGGAPVGLGRVLQAGGSQIPVQARRPVLGRPVNSAGFLCVESPSVRPGSDRHAGFRLEKPVDEPMQKGIQEAPHSLAQGSRAALSKQPNAPLHSTQLMVYW